MLHLCLGQNLVVLALRVPLPWDAARGIAVPILFRLYRSRAHCPEGQYKKRTELALELEAKGYDWIREEFGEPMTDPEAK